MDSEKNKRGCQKKESRTDLEFPSRAHGGAAAAGTVGTRMDAARACRASGRWRPARRAHLQSHRRGRTGAVCPVFNPPGIRSSQYPASGSVRPIVFLPDEEHDVVAERLCGGAAEISTVGESVMSPRNKKFLRSRQMMTANTLGPTPTYEEGGRYSPRLHGFYQDVAHADKEHVPNLNVTDMVEILGPSVLGCQIAPLHCCLLFFYEDMHV